MPTFRVFVHRTTVIIDSYDVEASSLEEAEILVDEQCIDDLGLTEVDSWSRDSFEQTLVGEVGEDGQIIDSYGDNE